MQKYAKIVAMKIISSSGIYTTIYHNDNFLLLFGKKQ